MSQAINKGKKWTEEEYEYLRKYYHTVDNKIIAKKLGRTPLSVRLKANLNGLKKINTVDDKRKEYALYKGEETIHTGTIEEIAKKEGVKPLTIYSYGTDSYLRRKSKSSIGNYKVLVSLDDNGED